MNEQLIIRLGSLATQPVQWLVWSSLTEEVIASGRLAQATELPELAQLLLETLPATRGSSEHARVLAYLTQEAPSFSLRGGTREILRGIIARGLGMR